MRLPASAALSIALLIFSQWTAAPDGGFFPEFAGSAETADQRAVIVHDAGRETIILQTAHNGDGSEFAWVIPTPTQTTRADITEGDPRIFDALYYLTEPRAHWYGRSGCTGCGGQDTAGSQEYAGVSVWEQFVVSDYTVSVLSAEDSTNLAKWLNDNGYRVPGAANDTLEHYVNKAWFFVAAKVRPGANDQSGPPGGGSLGGREGQEFKPLQIAFDTPELIFPMRISSVSSVGEVSVLLYVFAQHRVEGKNYTTTQVKAGEDWNGQEFDQYYEQKLREAVALAGSPGLVTEYAGRVDNWWVTSNRDLIPLDPQQHYFLTRLKTYLQPSEMQEDIVLTAAASDREFSVILASADPAASPVRLALTAFLLLGAVLGGRHGHRLRGWQRGVLLGLAALALVV